LIDSRNTPSLVFSSKGSDLAIFKEPPKAILMENPRRDLFIDLVVDRFVLKIIKLRSPPVSPAYPKQVWDYQKLGLAFAVSRSVLKSVPGIHFQHFKKMVRKLVKLKLSSKIATSCLDCRLSDENFWVGVERSWDRVLADSEQSIRCQLWAEVQFSGVKQFTQVSPPNTTPRQK